MPSPTDYTLSPTEAAALLGVSANALNKYADLGLVQCMRLPGRFRKYRREDIDAFAATLLPDAPAASAQ